jgi:hypothetical protein
MAASSTESIAEVELATNECLESESFAALRKWISRVEFTERKLQDFHQKVIFDFYQQL